MGFPDDKESFPTVSGRHPELGLKGDRILATVLNHVYDFLMRLQDILGYPVDGGEESVHHRFLIVETIADDALESAGDTMTGDLKMDKGAAISPKIQFLNPLEQGQCQMFINTNFFRFAFDNYLDFTNYLGTDSKMQILMDSIILYKKLDMNSQLIEDASEVISAYGFFHDRGDPATWDYLETGSKAVLNTDGNWHDLDLSAIVPAGAKSVVLGLSVKDDAIDSHIQFRKKGNVNIVNMATVVTQVANLGVYQDKKVACDTDRVIEYLAKNVAFTAIGICVKGWSK